MFKKYIGDPPGPFRVYRVGWGGYKHEVRIAGLNEDTSVFENGHWHLKCSLLKLEIFDNLEVYREGLVEALEGGQTIPKGTKCQFWGFDEDGDVMLRVGYHDTVISFQDLVCLDVL